MLRIFVLIAILLVKLDNARLVMIQQNVLNVLIHYF